VGANDERGSTPLVCALMGGAMGEQRRDGGRDRLCDD
jgi:hypothetical protein